MKTNNEDRSKTAGSLIPGEPVYLIAGHLRRPHGIHGEMVMMLDTDFPEHLDDGKTVYIGKNYEPHIVESLRENNLTVLIKFIGIETPETAGFFRNQPVYVRSDELPPLQDGVYYYHQLIGLEVLDESGQMIGVLSDILETGANDVYIVTTPAKEEILLAAIPDVIRAIDIHAGKMHVHLPEWL